MAVGDPRPLVRSGRAADLESPAVAPVVAEGAHPARARPHARPTGAFALPQQSLAQHPGQLPSSAARLPGVALDDWSPVRAHAGNVRPRGRKRKDVYHRTWVAPAHGRALRGGGGARRPGGLLPVAAAPALACCVHRPGREHAVLCAGDRPVNRLGHHLDRPAARRGWPGSHQIAATATVLPLVRLAHGVQPGATRRDSTDVAWLVVFTMVLLSVWTWLVDFLLPFVTRTAGVQGVILGAMVCASQVLYWRHLQKHFTAGDLVGDTS